MKFLTTVGCFLLVCATSISISPDASHASPGDDARLRAAIMGPELPKDLETVVDLLRKGANPNARDKFWRTAVHYAAGGVTGLYGTGRIFHLLLARGGNCCMKDSQGDTPLHFVVAAANDTLSDDAEVKGRIRRLLESGADPNESNRRGYTPLHFSAKTENNLHGTAIIGSLLQVGADPNAAARDGNTPLHLAAGDPVILDRGHGHGFSSMGSGAGDYILTRDGLGIAGEEAIDALLAGGADPNAFNDAGMTPLLLVLTNEYSVYATKSLLSGGADPNAPRPDDMTPLHIVLDYSEIEAGGGTVIAMVKALLHAGADPDTKNPEGDTPLHVAVRRGWGEDTVKALLAGDADPCIRNRKERFFPEQLARGLGQSDVELALQLAGGYMFDCEKREEEGSVLDGDARRKSDEEKLGLDRDARREIQSCLNAQGFDPGAPDGLFGPRTRSAISAWQEAQGEGEVTGYLTQDDLDALMASCRQAVPTPLCTGVTDTPCWMETANQPGCHIWNPNPAPEETVTWSGSCVDGKASGKGKDVWRFREDGAWKTSAGEGEMREGKLVGHWVWHTSDGEVWEGPFVDGESHGRLVKRGTRGEQWQCRSQGERVDPFHPLCFMQAADRQMQAAKEIALRSGPTDDYEQIGTLSAEEAVTVAREIKRWAWVETASGKQGFVPLSTLEELKVAAVVTEPKCSPTIERNCWLELPASPGCSIFVEDPVWSSFDGPGGRLYRLNRNLTKVPNLKWSGACSRNSATGTGTISGSYNYEISDSCTDERGVYVIGTAEQNIAITGEISLYGRKKGTWTVNTIGYLEVEIANCTSEEQWEGLRNVNVTEKRVIKSDYADGGRNGSYSETINFTINHVQVEIDASTEEEVEHRLEGIHVDGEKHGRWSWREHFRSSDISNSDCGWKEYFRGRLSDEGDRTC